MDQPTTKPIYLDYAATTPVDPRMVQQMLPFLGEHFGNPASRSHTYGRTAEEAAETARGHVAALIDADPSEIAWTSGATESNNLAIKGAAQFHQARGRHLVTLKTEHEAVLDTMRELERVGFEVSVLDVQSDGLLDIEVLRAALRPDTTLVSVMAVNNEVGVAQDIAAIGALYLRRKPRVRIEAQMHGGGHERGLRSGTLPTHQIVGMGEACRLARRVPHNLNVSFQYIEGESLLMGMKGLAVSSGSACTSASLEPSYVQRALGLPDVVAHRSIRFSIGRFATAEDIDAALQQVHGTVQRLRELSPLWDMHQAGMDLASIQWSAH